MPAKTHVRKSARQAALRCARMLDTHGGLLAALSFKLNFLLVDRSTLRHRRPRPSAEVELPTDGAAYVILHSGVPICDWVALLAALSDSIYTVNTRNSPDAPSALFCLHIPRWHSKLVSHNANAALLRSSSPA